MSAYSLQYIAGLFDGEGYVGIHLNPPINHHLRASITNNHYSVLEQIQKQFGGSLKARIKIQNRQQTYNLVFTQRIAEKFLLAIRPYLVIKAEQTDMALDFLKTFAPVGTTKHLDNQVVTLRTDMKTKLQAMKHGGLPSVHMLVH